MYVYMITFAFDTNLKKPLNKILRTAKSHFTSLSVTQS